MHTVNEALLDAQLAQLERAASWSPRVISKLEAFIRTADDYDLFRVDAIQYAAEKGLDESEAIDLFLHAAKIGLFDLEWNLICACCGQVCSSLRSIAKLNTHFVCNRCRMENHAQLDDLIQVSFTVALAVRDNVFRHPERLSAEDHVYRYLLVRGIVRQPSGLLNAEYLKACTPVLTYLEPGGTLTACVETTSGLVFAGDLLHGDVLTFFASPAEHAAPVSVHARFGRPDMRIASPRTVPMTMEFSTAHGDATFQLPHFAEITTGRSQWTFENHLDERALVWVYDAHSDVTSTWMELPPFLSGKRLLTSQTFRNLFRTEVIEGDEGLGIRDITFLFTDLKGSTALYDQLGDLKAYHLVRQHFDALNSVIADHAGATIKTIGDAVMAAFSTPQDGVRAALEILRAIEEFNQGRTEQLVLKIGVHTGHSIAVTLNERLDYFGQTVNIASRVQQLAEANEICISQDVHAHDGVCQLLTSCGVKQVQAQVKGVTGELQLYKVTLN